MSLQSTDSHTYTVSSDFFMELEEVAVQLSFITQTIGAITIAMSDGDTDVGDECLIEPYNALSDVNERINELVKTAFAKAE